MMHVLTYLDVMKAGWEITEKVVLETIGECRKEIRRLSVLSDQFHSYDNFKIYKCVLIDEIKVIEEKP